MFNKEYHHHDNSKVFPNTINIHEHRAPTDESVKTLHEMEEKARESVIAQISNSVNNGMSYEVFVCEIAVISFIRKFRLYFKLQVNGKRYDKTMTVDGGSVVMHDILAVGGGRHRVSDYFY